MAFIWLGSEPHAGVEPNDKCRGWRGRLLHWLSPRGRSRRSIQTSSSRLVEGLVRCLSDQNRPRDRDKGFSLAEVMVCLLVATLAILVLLQALTFGLDTYQRQQQQWEETLRQWNQATLFQGQTGMLEGAGQRLQLWPNGPELHRGWVAREAGQPSSRWEVLRATGP